MPAERTSPRCRDRRERQPCLPSNSSRKTIPAPSFSGCSATSRPRKRSTSSPTSGAHSPAIRNISNCNRYLKWVKENRKERTYQRAEFFLTKLSEEIGHLRIKDLKPFHVEDWLAKMGEQKTVQTEKGPQRRGWGKSSRRMALDVVLACLNYAVKKGFITRNPLAGKVDRPGTVSRSKDALIPPDVFRAMLTEQEKKYEPRYYPSHKG